MKRLLAMLLTLLFSVTNNVDFQMSGDVPFQVDGYYKLTGEEPTDYRKLYTEGITTSAIGGCTNAFFSVSDLLKSGKYEGTVPERISSEDGAFSYYWVEANGLQLQDLQSCGTEYTFENDGYIVVPNQSVILTESTDSGGHSMVLEDTVLHYRYVFNHMERWCCDLNRTAMPDEDGNVTWTHTVSLTGRKISGGYCIGIATGEETTFQITDQSGNIVDIFSFYNNSL